MQDSITRLWRSLAAALVACSLGAGLAGGVPDTQAASAKKSVAKHGKSGRSYVLEHKRRARTPRVRLPIGPSYVYYDYPYYYSRGHYPTHIVHYIYYRPYYTYRGHAESIRRSKARRK